MKQLVVLIATSLILFSCNDNESTPDGAEGKGDSKGNDSKALAELQAENDELRAQNAAKDSIIIETSKIFSDISDNLSQISYKRGQIRDRSQNVEIGEDPKAWIMQEINSINELRIANAKKVSELSSIIKSKEKIIGEQANTISGLNAMIDALNNEIMVQDQENESLKVQLEILDKDYASIFDSYTEATDKVEDLTDEVNTAYYVYGSKKELKDNGVITKEGSFIGLGGAKKLKNDFNDEYFEKIDILQSKEISIVGKKPELITTHPGSSYNLEGEDSNYTLKITAPEKFWGASKYLVIVVQ